jgi:UDP-2,3-diacylglucosamine pyrophosphatase LpxH
MHIAAAGRNATAPGSGYTEPMEAQALRSGDRPIYLVSDVHLGDGGWGDIFGQKDAAFLEFLGEVRARAGVLLIVGDAVDFQQAWTLKRILQAHRGVMRELSRLSEHLPVIYVAGNHDPDIELYSDLLRWEVVQEVIIDDRILVRHGDEYDAYLGGEGQHGEMATRVHNLFERLLKTWVRNPLEQHYTLANRIAHRVAYNYTRLARRRAERLRKRGKTEQAERVMDVMRAWSGTGTGDPMSLTRPVLDHLRNSPYELIVCGHSHLPGVLTIEAEKRYANLGSWSFANAQYGVLQRGSIVVRDWISQRVYHDENYRLVVDGDLYTTYEDWFRDNYMGYLQYRCAIEARRSGHPTRHMLGPLALGEHSTLRNSGTFHIITEVFSDGD